MSPIFSIRRGDFCSDVHLVLGLGGHGDASLDGGAFLFVRTTHGMSSFGVAFAIGCLSGAGQAFKTHGLARGRGGGRPDIARIAGGHSGEHGKLSGRGLFQKPPVGRQHVAGVRQPGG